jgi:hypothetical protein
VLSIGKGVHSMAHRFQVVSKKRICSVTTGVLCSLAAATSWAQNGAIAGLVRDTSGAVLPGVTVDARSPALTERIRTAVTDGQGQYKILDLRPGTYSVTFTLTGFKTVVRDRLELSAETTLNIPADLEVGGVEETVTVSGGTPLVDIQNVTQLNVVKQDVIEALPTGRTVQGFATLTPGMRLNTALATSAQDVGGSLGEAHLHSTIHGSRVNDSQKFFNGMKFNNLRFSGGGNLEQWELNAALAQEVVADIAGHSAETQTGAPRVDLIPKDGGQMFVVSLFANFMNEHLEANNVTPDEEALGAPSLKAVHSIWDVNPMFSGPLLRDRLWFFSSVRRMQNDSNTFGAYYAKDPLANTYAPDLSRPALFESYRHWEDLRLTWQASPRNKVAFFGSNANEVQPHSNPTPLRPPEASTTFYNAPDYLIQTTYASPVTSRVLVEAGATLVSTGFWSGHQPGQPSSLLPITELSTGLTFRTVTRSSRLYTDNFNGKAKVSFVSGSHALAAGMQFLSGYRREYDEVNDLNMNLQVLNGVPKQVVVWTTPYTLRDDVDHEVGLFGQDQWTLKRLTLNMGLRFDFLKASTPAQHLPAVLYVGARDFPAASDLPNWKDVSPRLGAAYDLFGTGKTAIKASISRYVQGMMTGIAEAMNPVVTTVNSTTRPWTDLNGDFIPQPDELGPLANSNFGKLNRVTTFDPNLLTGWGKRGYNWEGQVSLQQEVSQGFSVRIDYTRHWFRNFLANKNGLVSPSDYSPFCVTAPVDSRLPGGGGNRICGFYDINPDKFGLVQNVVGLADDFGNISDVYTGLDVNLDLRLRHGIRLQGGTSTGHEVTDICDVVGKVENVAGTNYALQQVAQASNPNGIASPSTLYCHVQPPLLTDLKALAVVPLPWWNISTSLTFQSLKGPEILATETVPNAQVAPSLGRDLSGGATVTTVQLVSPGTLYGDRINQLDFRTAKTFTSGRHRIQVMVDLYNLLNVSPVLTLNNTYGPAWQRPLAILPGRFLKFGTEITF